jgi:membrane associated rhomboid family serine protease
MISSTRCRRRPEDVTVNTAVARTSRSVTRSLKAQTVTLSASVGAMWITFAANAVLGGALLRFGIVPRTVSGLTGILVAPFLHANLNHLIANTIPFLLFGWLVMLRDRRHFLPVTFYAMLGAGLLAWSIGAPNSVHVGASGVIFGYLGFLLLSGWYARSVASIAVSVLVAVVWGGTIAGVLPGTPGVSWQGHLGGFIGGVLAARQFRVAR